MADYRIELGIGLKSQDLNKIKNDIKSLEDKPIRLEIDAETKELTKSIQEALRTLSKGGQNAFTIDTSDFNESIKGIKTAVVDLQKILGTLGDNINMKDLLSSVNQIANAIGKVTDESESLAKSLSILSKKDFGFNFNLKTGGVNPTKLMTDYGQAASRKSIPAIKEQINYLKDLINKTTDADRALNNYLFKQNRGYAGTTLKQSLEKQLSSGYDSEGNKVSKSDRMLAGEELVGYYKEIAALNNISLDGFNAKFAKSATEIVDDTTKIQTGVKQTEEAVESAVNEMKQMFGGGIGAEQLSAQIKPIIDDLHLIQEAITALSKDSSLGGLTASFNRLSESIENLLTNAEKVKGVLGSGLDVNGVSSTSTSTSSSTSAVKSAQQTGQQIGEAVTKSAQQSLNLDDVIDEQVLDLMNKFSIAGDKGSDAFNSIKQAVVECRAEINTIKNSDIGIDEEVFDTSRAIDKVTDAIANQHRVVNNLGNDYIALANYITDISDPKKGYKIQIPDFVKQEQGDDYRSNRSSLGAAFTTGKGSSFADFINQLNGDLGQTIDLTKGEAAAMDELLRKVELGRKQRDAASKSEKYLNSTASTEEILKQNGIDRNEIYDDVMSIVSAVDAAEQKIAQSSAEMASEVVQNEERKQQAYRETADAYEKISKTTSLTRDDADFQKTFAESNQAAQEAQRHFQGLLAEEKAVVSVTEQFDDNNALQSFTVNIKRASGEVETLRYAMDKLNNEGDGGFVYRGGSASDNRVEKQLETRIKKANELQIKLDKIKSGYDDMGAAKPIKDMGHIESLDDQYEKVKKAIIGVKNADDSTFSSMISNAQKEQAVLENMVREYRNAENIATSLRSKDIGTVKDTYASKLDVLVSKMKSSGVYTDGFEKGAENLRSVLSDATDASGLVKFLNGLDKLEAGYKRADAAAKEFNTSQKVGINTSGLESKIADLQRISPAIDRFETEIDGAKVSVKSLVNDLSQVKTQGDFSVVNARFKAFADAAKAAGIAVVETAQKAKSINDIKIKLNDTGFNGFAQEVNRAHAAADGLNGVYNDLETALKRLDAAMEGVYSADQAGDVQRLVAANEEYEAALKQVFSQLKLNQQAEKKAYDAEILNQKKSALNSEMEAWLKENTRAARDFGEEVRRLQASLDGLDDKGVKLVGQQFKAITKQAQAMGKTGLTTFDRLKSKVKEYTAYLSAAEMFMYAEQALRSMFEQVKLIDSAMTELKKVTDETDASYNKFLSNAASRSKELGTTIDGLVSSTADFARLGYGFEDAQGLAEVANIYAVVGDEIEGVEGATESLISTMAAFKDSANGMSNSDFAMSIIDKFNEIGNNFAISSGGIGEALERSASSLMAANNTLDEGIALITASNQVVQDPTAVGTAWKTISMRIRGAKTELEEAGLDTEGMVESTAKLRQEILALSGVDIMENANTFKSSYKIMDELAVKWKDLTDIQQASITELIAGKRQGNIVSSLMNNFDVARQALETSLNSSGSAMREHERASQSLEYKLTALKSTWQSLSQSFMNSDFLKSALDAVINLVNGLDKLIETVGTLPTLIGLAAGGFSALKNKGLFTFDKDAQSIELLGTQLDSLKGNYTQIQTAISRYNSMSSKSASFQAAYNKHLASSSTSMGKYLQGLNGAKASMGGYIASLVGAKVASFALQAATVALNAAITMGISFLISAGISAITKLINAKKELAEQVDELTSKFQEQHTELVKNKSSFESQAKRYGQLAKGVDDLGNNVSLTADEYAEYQDIINSIADQIPFLVQGYDSQGNAILSCKGNVEELTAAYEDLIKKQNDSVLKGDAYKDIETDFKNAMKEAESNSDGWFKTKASTNEINALESLLKSNNLDKSITDIREAFNENRDGAANLNLIIKELENAGIDKMKVGESSRDFLKRALTQNKDIVQRVINDFNANLDAEAAGMRSAAQAALSNAFDFSDSAYKDINEKAQSLIRQVVGNFNAEQFDKIIDSGKTVEEYINDMLDSFKNLSSDEAASLEAAFNLKTQFNGGEITYGEYVNGIREVEDLIGKSKLDEDIQNQIKLTLNTEQIKTDYEALKTRLTSEEYGIQMKDDKAEKFLNKLTASEYQVAIDLIDDPDVNFNDFDSIKELKKYIKEQAKINEAMAFTTDIKVDTTALETLNTALTESASAMGLTEESIDSLKAKYSKLESFDAATLFEATANGVKVNREELAKLEKEYNDLTKSEVKEHIDSLTEAYNDATVEIDKCTNASERAQLLSKREGYKTQIEELAEYQAQLEGVTGAYQRWIDAQNTPEDYEGYQAVATSREDIEDEIDRGFISNATKEYIDLLSGEDLVGGTIDDYAEAWDRLDKKVGSTSYSIHDFFTVNDDGDITATGIDRFFKGLQKDFEGEVATFNEKSGKWEYNFSQENLQKIQDEWGIGIEAIGLLLEAAASAGYDVDWDGILDGIDLDTSNFETLLSYAERAQKEFNELEGIDDVSFNFTATGIEEATSEVEKARKTYLDLITNKDGTINLKAEGAEQMRVILSTLLIQKQQLEDSNIAINIDTSGLDESQQDIANAIEAVKTFREKYKNLEIAVTTGQGIEEAKSELNTAMTELQGLGDAGVDIAAQLILGEGTDGETLKTKVDAAITAVGDKNIKVGCNLDETAIGTLNSQLLTNFNPEATVKITGIDDALVSQYTSTEKTAEGTVKWKNDESLVVQYQEKTKKAVGIVDWANNTENVKKSFSATGTVKWTSGNNVKVKVISSANGTANANGTADSGRAFKQGSWGIKGSGTALVGELGMETLVRGGNFYTIGDTGAEFIQYRPNDIIFNHKQTEELFRYGKVLSDGGRGKVYANGSAFAEGSYPSSGKAFNGWQADATLSDFAAKRIATQVVKEVAKTTKTTKTTKSATGASAKVKETNTTNNRKSKTSTSSKSSSSSSSTKEDFEESFDWIEVKISRLERAIDRLDKKANGTWRSWTSRNSALTKEISKVSEEINLQEKAYSAYIKEANSVGLSSSWKKKVQNGTLDISTVKDEALAEKIKDYQNWYEKALACKDAILDLKDAEADLYKQRFDNVQAKYDGILQGYEHTETMINEYIAQAEAQGHIVSTKYYEELIKNEKSGIKQLQKEQAELVKRRDEWLAAGGSKDSQDWRDMCADIDAVTQAIEEGHTSLLEYNKAIRDIEFETFELAQERLSNLTDEADFFVELMSNKKLHDDNGQLTDEGKATMGMYAQNHNVYMRQADDYGTKAQSILDRMALDPSDKNYLDPLDQANVDKYYEYLGLQRESILNAEKQKNAIRDLIEEGINLELEALQERIDKQNESLQSAKDLYDYNKKVKDQTKEIASLEKQMSAYSGDNSEESKAKIQEIKVQLEEAKENLQETEWDKYISDQSALLDNLYNEYETILNSRLDNIDGLISDAIVSINENAGTIAETINGVSSSVGYTMSELMKTIWGEAYKQVQADNATRVSQLTGAVNGLITNGLITKEQGNSLITSLGDGSTGSATATLNRIKEMLANGEIGQADANELIASLSLGNQEQVKASLNSMNDWVADKKMSQQDADAITKAFVTGNADDIRNANNLLNSLVQNGTLTANDIKSITNALKGSQVKGDNIVTEYGKDFGKKDTTVNNAVNEVKKQVDNAVKASDKEAKKNVNKNSTSTSAKKDPTKDNKKTTTTNKTTTTTNKGNGKAEVGDKVKFVSGEYYYSSDGLKPKGTKNLGKDVYITKINTKSWATHPYHISTGKKLGSGDLGWLKLKQLKGYATGKKNFLDDELAWTQEGRKQEFIIRPSDGAILTPVAKGDSVLNATASGNIWSMANNPAEFIKNSLGLDSANIPNASNVSNTYTQHLENVNINLPNVHSYDELLMQMKKDKNFERLILSMSIDRVAGKSALAKGKAIR